MYEKLTPWFPGDVKPVHEGVYPRKFSPKTVHFSKWESRIWHLAAVTPELAARQTIKSFRQSLPWRGLAQDPSKEGV